MLKIGKNPGQTQVQSHLGLFFCGADWGQAHFAHFMVQIGDRPKLHILYAGAVELGYEAFFGSFTFLDIGFGDT